MSYYLTPAKPTNSKSNRIYTQQKPTDWICVVCNNLNFSFRKKCNRCKTQTRTENENQLANAYSDYYYQSPQYLSVAKMPLGDITNSHTPQHRYHNNQEKHQDLPRSAQNQNCGNAKIEPFQSGLNIFGSSCWDSINNQQAQTEEQEKVELEEQKSVCEFTDVELEFLINRILIEDQ